jgi:heme exporter protein B
MQAKRFMFYYQLYDPIELAISKIAYNAVLLFLLGVILFILMSVLSINPIVNTSLFLQALILGSLGIGSTISFTSLIASKGQQTHILISVLSMPIIIPILLLLVKITAVAMGILGDSSIGTDFLLLAGINMFSIGLCLILFPYLWRI